MSFSGPGTSTRRQRKRVFSGYSPGLAVAALLDSGCEEAALLACAKTLMLQRFPEFAGSWNSYIASHGYIFELDELPPEVQDDYERRYGLRSLMSGVDKPSALDPRALTEAAELGKAWSQLIKLQQAAGRDPIGQHPALPALTTLHRMPEPLAQAVILYQQSVPWWVIGLIFFFAALAALVFIAAFVTPQSGAFNTPDVGGVGPGQLVAAPLFSVLFFAVGGWLWRNSPRRNAAWRAALESYRKTA